MRRVIWAVFVVALMSVLAFSFVRLIPGDPALILLGQHPDPKLAARIHREMGLDRPLATQYVHWIDGVLRGNLGHSLEVVGNTGLSGTPVISTIESSLSVTLPLAALGMVIAVSLGGLVGAITARWHGSFWDGFFSIGTFLGISFPDFYLAILLILLFGLAVPILPPTGWVAWSTSVWGAFKHLLMPAVAIGVINAAAIARTLRASLIEVKDRDFIRAAEAHGVPEVVVFLKHGLRNALLPTLTVVGLQLGYLVGGAVIVENVFALPGIGFNLIDAVNHRDYPTIQGITLVFALMFALINLVTDLAYAVADPTVRATLRSGRLGS